MKHARFAATIVIWGAAAAQAQVVVDQAATAGESYARGMSGIISAQGQKNVDDLQRGSTTRTRTRPPSTTASSRSTPTGKRKAFIKNT